MKERRDKPEHRGGFDKSGLTTDLYKPFSVRLPQAATPAPLPISDDWEPPDDYSASVTSPEPESVTSPQDRNISRNISKPSVTSRNIRKRNISTPIPVTSADSTQAARNARWIKAHKEQYLAAQRIRNARYRAKRAQLRGKQASSE